MPGIMFSKPTHIAATKRQLKTRKVLEHIFPSTTILTHIKHFMSKFFCIEKSPHLYRVKRPPPLLHTPHTPMMTYEYLTIYICPLQWYELYKNQQLCSYVMLSGPNPIQWSYQCGSKGLSNPALWNCPRVEELSCSQCHRKKIVNFLHTKHVSHIVLYYNNIMKMPWCPYPMPPKKSTKKHKMGNMYSGTFSNKRTSKSLFKKSKVQLKKPCCPLTTATITTSFIQPIFLPWNHFLKNEIYSLTDIAITIRYTTHISANGLLIEWFFR